VNFLILGVCIGERCSRLLPAWLDTIRRVGGFTGDVLVLCDRETPRLMGAHFANVEPTIERWGLKTATNCKPLIQHHAYLGIYDYLLYLDMDVLVNTARLVPMIETQALRGRLAAQRDVRLIGENRINTGMLTLTDDEKSRYGHEHGACAGVVGVPTNATGREFLTDWLARNQEALFDGSDQSRLVQLFWRQYRGLWDYLDDCALVDEHHVRRSETLLHFAGRYDYELLRYWHEHLT
jgi:hypothetical protein